MYLPTLVTVGHYFKKKRALATGIAVCGSGIGGFIFAPLSQYLIEMYTWKGAMWIIAAICLNGVVIGTLLRPIESIECAPVVMEFDNRQENDNRKQNNNRQENGQDQKLIKKECLESEVVSGKRQCCDASEFFDFSLLKSLTFLVYGCSCFLCMLGKFWRERMSHLRTKRTWWDVDQRRLWLNWVTIPSDLSPSLSVSINRRPKLSMDWTVDTLLRLTLENHRTRTAQSSCVGCSRRVHRIMYLADKRGNILLNILLIL